MQPIVCIYAGVKCPLNIRQRQRITHGDIEINHAVENRVGAEPRVYGLPRGFARGRVIAIAAERRDRRPPNQNVLPTFLKNGLKVFGRLY